jgi:acyl-CoA thioesterase
MKWAMDSLFFDLRPTHNPHRWYLALSPAVCVGPPDELFMFGGVGLGAAIGAMERTCGRPVVWATAQYLSYARPDSIVDLDVWTPAVGKYNTQARVVGHVDDREIFTVNAALGERPSEIKGQWAPMPDAPPPEDCPAAEHWRGSEGTLNSRIEVRVAKGRYGRDREGHAEADGRSMIWIRPKEGYSIDSSMLAIIADFVPSGIGNALGRNAGGNSLDNTIRVRRIVPTEWVLCDIHIHGVHAGFGHGTMHLFAQDGELMATASQSLILRVRKRPDEK